MKNLITLTAIIVGFHSLAQNIPPQAINFQGVAIDKNGIPVPGMDELGNPIQNSSIRVRFSIITGTVTGNISYQEEHITTTDEFGRFNLEIGRGIVTNGVFSSINWGSDKFFLQVEVDLTSLGTNYILTSVQEFLSVPYALYAGASKSSDDDLDKDPTNELQNLTITNDTVLMIANGNSVTLPTSIGPQGPQGAPGPQGPIGPQGLAGPAGAQGPTGPQGVQGPQGSTGPQGSSGPSGADGKTILNGIIAPTSTQGSIGDFYLNTTNNLLYGPKNTMGWGIGTSLIGPQGPQGLAGATGGQGATGLQGPQGITGPSGPQGPQGVPGPQGPQGVPGPQGPAGPIGLTGPPGSPGGQNAILGVQNVFNDTIRHVHQRQGNSLPVLYSKQINPPLPSTYWNITGLNRYTYYSAGGSAYLGGTSPYTYPFLEVNGIIRSLPFTVNSSDIIRIGFTYSSGCCSNNFYDSTAIGLSYQIIQNGVLIDNDNDPINELQTLSINNQSISISNGNSIIIPNNTDNQTLSISGNDITISGGNSVSLMPLLSLKTDTLFSGRNFFGFVGNTLGGNFSKSGAVDTVYNVAPNSTVKVFFSIDGVAYPVGFNVGTCTIAVRDLLGNNISALYTISGTVTLNSSENLNMSQKSYNVEIEFPSGNADTYLIFASASGFNQGGNPRGITINTPIWQYSKVN